MKLEYFYETRKVNEDIWRDLDSDFYMASLSLEAVKDFTLSDKLKKEAIKEIEQKLKDIKNRMYRYIDNL